MKARECELNAKEMPVSCPGSTWNKSAVCHSERRRGICMLAQECRSLDKLGMTVSDAMDDTVSDVIDDTVSDVMDDWATH